jgi:hypothetical protein
VTIAGGSGPGAWDDSAMAEVLIERRFRGPEKSGNGGYSCAMLVRAIEGPAEVTLKAPPPLERPLTVAPNGSEGVLLLDGEDIVAVGVQASLDRRVPHSVSLQEAQRASERYEWVDDHPYPACFVCGPTREAGDGLRIFPGPVEGRELYAAPWTPDESVADEDGTVHPEFAWAALDCPSGIVTDLFGEIGTILLGRLAADLIVPLRAGETYVATAWPVARDGRKLDTGSALHTVDGEMCAVARARWIELET